MMVVLPAPVCPTMATVSSGSMVKLTSRNTQSNSSPAVAITGVANYAIQPCLITRLAGDQWTHIYRRIQIVFQPVIFTVNGAVYQLLLFQQIQCTVHCGRIDSGFVGNLHDPHALGA